jgi:signal transduction histidine kinase
VKIRQDYRRKRIDDFLRKETLCAQLLRAVALLSDEAADIKDLIQLCLRKICDTTAWPVAHARILLQNDLLGPRLPEDIWHVAAGKQSESLHKAIDVRHLQFGISCHVRIVEAAKPILFSDLAQEVDFPGRQEAHEFGLKSAFGMPVLVRDKLKAVCEFFSYEPLRADVLWEEVMASIASALARTIEHKWLERSLSEMRNRLLNLQDDERRRLARELHDSAGQNMALIVMNTDTLERESQGLSPTGRAKIAECGSLARESLQEIRTSSYLLHPPMVDELGVLAALRVFIEGFSERSGIRVDLDLPKRLIRLPRDL